MARNQPTRRGFVTILGGLGLASIPGTAVVPKRGSSASDTAPLAEIAAVSEGNKPAAEATVARESYTILAETEHATDVYVIRAEADGPTVMVVGGVHGNEESGYRAANDVTTWEIDAGTLVVLPEANTVAIERDTRVGADGDLNRQFPTSQEPTSELARAIWDVVLRHQPTVLIDLHRSIGIYGEDGHGQAIFHAPDEDAGRKANDAVEYMNDEVVPDSLPSYEFSAVPISFEMDPSGLLVGKAAQDRGIQSFLVEVTSMGLELDTQVQWTKQTVRQLLGGAVLLDEPPKNDAPVARIWTTPSDATERTLDVGATVDLAATRSSDQDGDVVEYEWDLDGDGTFEANGEATTVTLEDCDEYTFRLRVTDDDGRTDTAAVTLSTVE